MDGAEETIKATEKNLESFKVSDSTGNNEFKVWIVPDKTDKYSLLSNTDTDSNYVLFTDNENAVYENGVLTFRGGSWIYFIPNEAIGYTLYIESEDGSLVTYYIEVTEAHTCVSSGKQVMIAPTESYDGFAIECCETCGELMDIITLYSSDLCEAHTYGEWKTTLEATCTAGGIKIRICDICGHEEADIIPSTQHKESAVSTVAPTCTNEGYTTYSCLCGEHTHTEVTSPKTEHSYNGDGMCEACGNEKEDFRDENEECTCKCHRRGIGAFFWKIGEFFRRLFGKRHVCDCANAILCAFTKETLGNNLN